MSENSKTGRRAKTIDTARLSAAELNVRRGPVPMISSGGAVREGPVSDVGQGQRIAFAFRRPYRPVLFPHSLAPTDDNSIGSPTFLRHVRAYATTSSLSHY